MSMHIPEACILNSLNVVYYNNIPYVRKLLRLINFAVFEVQKHPQNNS